MKVLDSNFLIEILRKNPEAKIKIEELMSLDDPIAITVFNAHEVLFGASITNNQKNYQIAQRLLESVRFLDYTIGGLYKTIELKSFLRKKGISIGVFDEMIAGICLAHGATIITKNVKHFKRVPNLKVETW